MQIYQNNLKVALIVGALGSVARYYAHKIAFIFKVTHNEALTYPSKFGEALFYKYH